MVEIAVSLSPRALRLEWEISFLNERGEKVRELPWNSSSDPVKRDRQRPLDGDESFATGVGPSHAWLDFVKGWEDGLHFLCGSEIVMHKYRNMGSTECSQRQCWRYLFHRNFHSNEIDKIINDSY